LQVERLVGPKERARDDALVAVAPQRLAHRFYGGNVGEDAQHDIEAIDPDRMALRRQIGRTERRRLGRSAVEGRARQSGPILDREPELHRRVAQPVSEVSQPG
jgi:hypothetical protein